MSTNGRPHPDKTSRDVLLTAYALGQLDNDELHFAERLVDNDPEANVFVAAVRRLGSELRESAKLHETTMLHEANLEASSLRSVIECRLRAKDDTPNVVRSPESMSRLATRYRWASPMEWTWRAWCSVSVVSGVLVGTYFLLPMRSTQLASGHSPKNEKSAANVSELVETIQSTIGPESWPKDSSDAGSSDLSEMSKVLGERRKRYAENGSSASVNGGAMPGDSRKGVASSSGEMPGASLGTNERLSSVPPGMMGMGGTTAGGMSGMGGSGAGMGMPGMGMSLPGIGGSSAGMGMPGMGMGGGGSGMGEGMPSHLPSRLYSTPSLARSVNGDFGPFPNSRERSIDRVSGEGYERITESDFVSPTQHPLSTFSIDVDTASYTNVRRFLMQGQLPPPDAVRVEEFLNYFPYEYVEPARELVDGQIEPFATNMEVAQCPWNSEHQLIRIGLKGRTVRRESRPPSNLVFLLDVSGSMASDDKLPLVKQAMSMLVNQLTENDRVAIVTYAGDAGLRLDSTTGEQKEQLLSAVQSLSAGGSTNGSAGIQMAYDLATRHFIKGGTNRVILATDGDLNVGVTSDEALVQLIEAEARRGVFLTVLGFGQGNLQDGKLEKIADHGNGMYTYVDGIREARRVFVEQLTANLITIAKDVKIQIEFNPTEVHSYRLIGYENRAMAAQDFANDAKDAGDIGAGHTVTALYEFVPAGRSKVAVPRTKLRYQTNADESESSDGVSKSSKHVRGSAETSGELLTLSLRYKQPDGQSSVLREFTLKNVHRAFGEASRDFRFAASVAEFGMLLRGSPHCGNSSFQSVEEIARSTLAFDPEGHRGEFVDLVRRARALAGH